VLYCIYTYWLTSTKGISLPQDGDDDDDDDDDDDNNKNNKLIFVPVNNPKQGAVNLLAPEFYI